MALTVFIKDHAHIFCSVALFFLLQLHELSPFIYYVFRQTFGVELSGPDVESIFHLIDMDKDTVIGFPEFLMFVLALKQIEFKCKNDAGFAQACFGDRFAEVQESKESKRKSWNKSMQSLEDSLRAEAVDSFCTMLNGMDDRVEEDEKIRQLFEAFDSDGSGTLDMEELLVGLLNGVHVHSKQAQAPHCSLGDGEGTCVTMNSS